MIESPLKTILGEMRAPQEGLEYYALTLFADESGKIMWASQSSFFGYKSRTPIIELRVAHLVIPETMISLWQDAGQNCCVVSSRKHLYVYLQIGGNALVESSIATKLFPSICEPLECRPTGLVGFITATNLPKTALQRAPTPAVRMRVLKRDGYRCRLCGRRPADHVDVELHVHHARPWTHGGATIEDNLITLCGTCHRGLNPHFETELLSLLGPGLQEQLGSSFHHLGVTRYRAIVRKLINAEAVERGQNGPKPC